MFKRCGLRIARDCECEQNITDIHIPRWLAVLNFVEDIKSLSLGSLPV